jgi:hypothetical protein
LRICPRCLEEFDEKEKLEESAARDLGDTFLKTTTNMNIEDICPHCREEMGVVALFGFGR